MSSYRKVVYKFLYYSNINDFQLTQLVIQNIKDSKVVIIDHVKECYEQPNDLYFIIGFKNTIIVIIKDLVSSILNQLFSYNENIEMCFLTSKKYVFLQNIKIKIKELVNDSFFDEERSSFNFELRLISSQYKIFRKIWDNIISCISGYWIKEGYCKTLNDRIDDFYDNKDKPYSLRNIGNDEYIKLRLIDIRSFHTLILIYHIDDEKLYVFKKANIESDEGENLKKREKLNYLKIRHQFIPKFIGISNENIIIEYINGQTLQSIESFNFNESEKFKIILQLLSVFKYLHDNGFIYGDLKPDNLHDN